jgi:hypothetical protein
MMKRSLALLICLLLSGCAYTQYSETYKNALRDGSGVSIIRQENYQELKQRIAGYFEGRGYKTEFADQKRGFVVMAKQGDFEEPCQIILKFTVKPHDNKIRVDLVKGNDSLVTESEMTNDIEHIADQIKNH